MAVHKKGDQSGQQQSNQSQQQYGGEQQQYGQQEAPNYGNAGQQGQSEERVGIRNFNRQFRRSGSISASETRSADALRALREAEKEAVEAQGLTADFEIFRFDRDAHRVGLPAVLITKTIQISGTTYCAMRPLVLESSAIHLPPKVTTENGQRIETPSYAQDVYSDTYLSRIKDFLCHQKGNPNLVMVDAGPLNVPSDFSFKEEPDRVMHLLITSVNRCDDVIERLKGEAPFRLNHIKRSDERLKARIDFSEKPVQDLMGYPIRSDLRVALSSEPNLQGQQADEYYEREREFNSVSGYINLEYNPSPAMQQTAWGQQQQAPQATQLFTPTFVITSVDQADWIEANTMEQWFLGVSNAYRVTANHVWIKSLMPQMTAEGLDPRDIGALGWLTAMGKKIETKKESFTDQMFLELVHDLIRPNLAFVIDVNPMGEHSGIENYLLDAAFEGPNRDRAHQKLVQALDNLTNGWFSREFDSTKHRIVDPYYNQEIHLGHYTAADGEERDIRDLDMIAALNYTQGDVATAMDWYRTYVDTSTSAAVRLQRRELYERQFLGKQLKITGRAVRLLLVPQAIEALDRATRNSGVAVDLENVTNVYGAQRFVGNTLVDQYVVNSQAQPGYQSSTVGNAGPSYAGVSGTGRLY